MLLEKQRKAPKRAYCKISKFSEEDKEKKASVLS